MNYICVCKSKKDCTYSQLFNLLRLLYTYYVGNIITAERCTLGVICHYAMMDGQVFGWSVGGLASWTLTCARAQVLERVGGLARRAVRGRGVPRDVALRRGQAPRRRRAVAATPCKFYSKLDQSSPHPQVAWK